MQSMIPKKCIWTVANPQTDVAYLYFIKKNQTMESEWIGDLNYISIQVQVSWHCSSLTSFDAVIVNIWNSCEHYGDCLNLHHMFGRSQSPGWIDICSVSQQHCTFKTGSYKAANRKKIYHYSITVNPVCYLWAHHIFFTTRVSDVLWVSARRRSCASSCLSFNSHNFTRRLRLVFWDLEHNLWAKNKVWVIRSTSTSRAV